MDKLKPILAQKFWIISGVALITPIVGWWMMKGKAEETYDARVGVLSSRFSDAQKPVVEGPDWAPQLKKFTERNRERLELAERQIYERQKKLKIWPESIAHVMADCPEGGQPEVVNSDVRLTPTIYRDEYPFLVREIWRIIEPEEDFERPTPGKVSMPIEVIPQFDDSQWQSTPPMWDVMWDEQQDLWLLGSLMHAVKNVNAGSTRIGDSTIRRVDFLSVFSGVRRVAGEASSATSEGSSLGDADEDEYGSSGFGSQDGGESSNKTPSVDIDVADQFDAVIESAGQAGGSRGGDGDSEGSDSGESSSENYSFDANSGSSGERGEEAEEVKPSRYVDDNEETPYRTRGFKINVVMEQQRIPDFLAALVNLPWPVEIVRMQFKQFEGGRAATSFGSSGSSGEGSSFSPSFESSGNFEDADEDSSEFSSGGTRARAPLRALTEEQKRMQRIDSALNESGLAEVSVVGLLTLYKAPETEAAADGGAEAVQPDATALPAEGTNDAPATTDDASPTTPAAPATQPADGDAPATTPAKKTTPAADPLSGDSDPPATNETPPDGKPAERDPLAP